MGRSINCNSQRWMMTPKKQCLPEIRGLMHTGLLETITALRRSAQVQTWWDSRTDTGKWKQAPRSNQLEICNGYLPVKGNLFFDRLFLGTDTTLHDTFHAREKLANIKWTQGYIPWPFYFSLVYLFVCFFIFLSKLSFSCLLWFSFLCFVRFLCVLWFCIFWGSLVDILFFFESERKRTWNWLGTEVRNIWKEVCVWGNRHIQKYMKKYIKYLYKNVSIKNK